MTKFFTLFIGFIVSLGLIFLENANVIAARTPLYNFVSVLAYSIFGTTILFSSYKFIDWLIEADIEAEIFEKQNLAAAVFKGLILVSLAVIIAAVIITP